MLKQMLPLSLRIVRAAKADCSDEAVAQLLRAVAAATDEVAVLFSHIAMQEGQRSENSGPFLRTQSLSCWTSARWPWPGEDFPMFFVFCAHPP